MAEAKLPQDDAEIYSSSLGDASSSLDSIESTIVVEGDELIAPEPVLASSEGLLGIQTASAYNKEAALENDDSYNGMTLSERRRSRVVPAAAMLAAVTIAGVLVANVGQESGDAPRLARTIEQQTPTPPVSEQFKFGYRDVKVHFVQFAGATVFRSDKQKMTHEVSTALEVLDSAHKGKLDIADLPVTADPNTYDLTEAGVSTKQFCDVPSGDASQNMNKSVTDALAQQTPLNDETLDIIIANVEPSPCFLFPAATAAGDDIVIYRPKQSIVGVTAHEINHKLGYNHDETYSIVREGNVISPAPKPNKDSYGNWQTIAGSGAAQIEITDPDPLSGYELYDHKVINPEQVADIQSGTSQEIQIAALNNSNEQDVKLIRLPLKPGTIDDRSAVMLELSNEDGRHTLKAYTIREGELLPKDTIAFPLAPDGRRLGLSADEIDQPVVLKLSESELIQIKLTGLQEGSQASAGVMITRS